ncbi:MAG: DUF5694 domain-containing protein, partial [Halobacteriaceae archaeon]
MDDDVSDANWPKPRDGEARITLLASHHLANPGNDEHNLEFGNTLAPERQRELEALREHLETRDFESIALEIPREMQDELDEQYAAVRGGVALDDEYDFPDGPARIRGEEVQVGFRLADALGLENVHAVDSHPPTPDIDASFAIDIDPESVPYSVPDFESLIEDERDRIANESLIEMYRKLNR